MPSNPDSYSLGRQSVACLCLLILAGLSVPLLTASQAVARSKHHPSPLPSNATYRSSNHKIAARITNDPAFPSELRWHKSVAYPYKRACAGPAPIGAIAGQIYLAQVPLTFKRPYVGTSFTGEQSAGGTQYEPRTGGYRSIVVKAKATGKVVSAKLISGTVKITETRYFGTNPNALTPYTSCGSSFGFKLFRYKGAYPGAAAF